MTFEEIKEVLESELSEDRFLHTVGVVKVALHLANLYDEDLIKAGYAALLHDCAKEFTDEEVKEFCTEHKIDLSYLDEYKSIVHSHLGEYVAKYKFGIEDSDILSAIKYHTTGKADMTNIEKIVYIADFIEPNRANPNCMKQIETARDLASISIDDTLKYILEQTKEYLKGKNIYEDTLKAIDFYK